MLEQSCFIGNCTGGSGGHFGSSVRRSAAVATTPVVSEGGGGDVCAMLCVSARPLSRFRIRLNSQSVAQSAIEGKRSREGHHLTYELRGIHNL